MRVGVEGGTGTLSSAGASAQVCRGMCKIKLSGKCKSRTMQPSLVLDVGVWGSRCSANGDAGPEEKTAEALEVEGVRLVGHFRGEEMRLRTRKEKGDPCGTLGGRKSEGSAHHRDLNTETPDPAGPRLRTVLRATAPGEGELTCLGDLGAGHLAS